MDDLKQDDPLPPDDGSAEHDVLRVQRALRGRTEESARLIMDASDRLHVAQVRAMKAKIPEEQVLTLMQALRHACEMHVLTMDSVGRQLDRLVELGSAAAELRAAAGRQEKSLQEWEERLGRTEAVWLRSAEEAPRKLAAATEQVLWTMTRRTSWFLRWAITVGIALAVVSGLSAYWSWRTRSYLEQLLPRLAPSEVQDGADHGKRR